MKKILIIGFIGFVSYSFAQSDEATKNLQKEADKLKAEQADSISPWKKGGVITLSGQLE